MTPHADPTTRFSNRVDDYARYRPNYPREAIDVLIEQCCLTGDSVVADVGCGTGIFARVLLERGVHVIGVEPNDAMADACEKLPGGDERFTLVRAAAEATTLPGASVDLVTAAQAFHWFDRRRARAEFERVLRPRGWIALLWNDRQIDTTPFLRDYERLLQQFGTDYNRVNHANTTQAEIAAFYAPGQVGRHTFPNAQSLDHEALRGRLLSSSYTPGPDDPRRDPMLARLRDIFDAHATDGAVEIHYTTEVYLGRFH